MQLAGVVALIVWSREARRGTETGHPPPRITALHEGIGCQKKAQLTERPGLEALGGTVMDRAGDEGDGG